MVKKIIEKTEAKINKLQEIQDLISTLTWEKGIEAFLFKRTSPKTGIKQLTVYGLGSEIVDEQYFILTDIQDKLLHNDLSMFIPKQISKVRTFKNKVGHEVISLQLTSGNKIIIEALPEVKAPEEVWETYDAAMAVNA